ncbi:hypothetical protein DN752_12985 [Echinicola strongylocentroti]|uniref:histidine kinase n=1 Tax=Echinicola strongylocentroti TaxID=1795355 RepID=A0A2Z4IJR5_9BACT|nr:PAS domain-containing sensor histidine kinase [Echinicola strongylocentroti]AWW30967.1 hypothetical protein DN752_12985 [Echinicola strongylocentroti]
MDTNSREIGASMLTFRRFSFGEYDGLYLDGYLKNLVEMPNETNLSKLFFALPTPKLEKIYRFLAVEQSLVTFILIDQKRFVPVKITGNVIKETSSSLINVLITPIVQQGGVQNQWVYNINDGSFFSHFRNSSTYLPQDKDITTSLGVWFPEVNQEIIADFIQGLDNGFLSIENEITSLVEKKATANENYYLLIEKKHPISSDVPSFSILQTERFDKNIPKSIFYHYQPTKNQLVVTGDIKDMLGYSDSAPIILDYKTWLDMVHEEDREALSCLLDEDANVSDSREQWYRVRHQNENYVHVRDVCWTYTDHQSGEVGFLGWVKLGTKWEYQVGEEIKSNCTLSELADFMPGFYYVYQKKGYLLKPLFAADKVKDVLGVDKEYFIRNFNNIVQQLQSKSKNNTENQQKLGSDILQILLPNQSVQWIFTTDFPLTSGGEEVYIGYIVNLTWLREIKSEGKDQDEERKTYFDYNPLVIFQFNAEGTILNANKTLFQKTNTTDKSKFIGKSIHDLYKKSPVYTTLIQGVENGFAQYEGPFISFLSNRKYYVGLTVRKHEIGDVYQAAFEDISEKDFVQRVLNSVAAISAHYNDIEFFQQLVQLLSQKLSFSICMIGEFIEQKDSIQSIAVSKNGELAENLTYQLKNTPCEHAVKAHNENVIIVPDHVSELFPKDDFLKEESLLSYCSIGIKDKSGKKVGILVLADTRPIHNKNVLINIVSILSDRAGAELQRMRYEKELIASQQLYKSIAENFPKGTIDVLDQNLEYIYTEGSEYRHLGINPKELIGVSHLQKYDSSTAKLAKEKLEEVFEGKTVTYEIAFNEESYKKIGVPLRNEHNEVTRALLVTQNISAYKKAEVEREKLIRDLSSHNEELQHFAYIVSHNLRAPIVNITSLLDLINEEDLSAEENKELFDSLKVSTAILNTTLMDLIEVVSIKKKKIIRVDHIDFDNILNNIEKSLHRQLKDAKAKIHRDFQAPAINYVYSHLENFLLNFMTNAIKYKHPERLPEIWISTSKDGDRNKITFSDNGIGIDLDKYGDRIFGLYQRFHNHVEGKGLGLYLIKEQIRSLDGEIVVESTEGKGTTFIVFLHNLPLPQESS